MKSVDFTDRLYSIQTTKKFGLPNELGSIWLGVSKLGDYNPDAGIYRRARGSAMRFNYLNATLGMIQLGYNNIGSDYLKPYNENYKNKIIVKEKFYTPYNPQTVPQQSWRNYFATVLASWQALTENEKDIWRKYSYPEHMSGYNRYLSKHLNARDL